MTENDQIAAIESDRATDRNGSIATIRHFQKRSFTTGVIVSELVAVFNRNGRLVWGEICI